MNCPKCGTELPDEADFCIKCGAPQKPRPVSEIYKPNRRAEIAVDIGGNVEGKTINVGTGSQTVTEYSKPDEGTRRQEELENLWRDLKTELEKLSATQQADVLRIEAIAREALDEAKKEQPNKRLLAIRGEDLRKAAENLASVAPIAVRIAKTLLLLG